MSRHKEPKPDKRSAEPISVQYGDPEALANMCLRIKAEGFVPADDLKTDFGPEQFTRGIAVLYRDLRMLREVRRAWKDGSDVLGYEWADRRFSKAEQGKIPPQLGFVLELTTKLAPKYSDFVLATLTCEYTTPALGGIPREIDKETVNTFDRDRDGRLVIQRYGLRACFERVMPLIGKEQALARQIRWMSTRIEANGNLSKENRPVNDHGQGKGFCRSEVLAAGTRFTIAAYIPTSMLTMGEFIEAAKKAGETIGLSPGRSAGFGEFEVIDVA